MTLKNHYFLLRHGTTTWNHRDICYPIDNATSVGLNEEGRKQIKTAAIILKRKKIDLIFSSDYKRIRQTSKIVSGKLGLPVKFDKRLRDLNLGIYHGRSKADYCRDLPLKIRFQKRPKKGESWNDLKGRTKNFLLSVEEKFSDKRILIIGHGDPLWILEGLVKGLSDADFLRIYRKYYISKGELRKIS